MVKIQFGTPSTPSATTDEQLKLTKEAATRIKTIIAEKNNDAPTFLRISVSGGGCNGYSYSFKLTDEKLASDLSIKNEDVDDVEVLIDMMSFNYLKGSTVDFEETLEASQFVIKNPNAKTSCGCGNSFGL